MVPNACGSDRTAQVQLRFFFYLACIAGFGGERFFSSDIFSLLQLRFNFLH